MSISREVQRVGAATLKDGALKNAEWVAPVIVLVLQIEVVECVYIG